MKLKIDAAAAAIKARDGSAFDGAHAQITVACNTRPGSLAHASVMIVAPSASPYADQAF